jgi:predicted nucleotidyltransferase
VSNGDQSLLEYLAVEAEVRGLRFLLIGGWALEAYQFARQTVDVDCLIAEPDVAQVDSFLPAAGFNEIARTANFRRYRHADFGYLDLLIVDPATFGTLYASAQPFAIGSVTLKVPSLPNLIALKLHGAKNDPAREGRELADIEQLARRGPVSSDEIKKLCAQFGPPDIWNKLKSRLYGND